MRYYKVIKDNKVIDVLNSDEIYYLKYSRRHKCMFNAKDKQEAQAIYSSDRKYIWHVNTLHDVPVEGYDTVRLVEVDVYEYEHLKMLNGKTPQEIIDTFLLELIENGVI